MYHREPAEPMTQVAIRLKQSTLVAIDAHLERQRKKEKNRHHWAPRFTRSDFMRTAIDQQLNRVKPKKK